MSAFTTRPEILGRFGVVTSTHWIASGVGMKMLEQGGNAFDAAVATGLVLQVLEPHLNGPGGDMPAILYSAAKGKVEVICAQAPTPAGATIDHYRGEGLEVIPGDGLLATVIPGAWDGWMLMLRDYGRLSLRDVLEPAIFYAEKGHPVLPRVAATIAGLGDFFAKEWPTSHATWLPGGSAPAPWANVTNPALAATWTRILSEAESKQGREAQIDAARDAFYRGFVAEGIAAYLAKAEVMDASGQRHKAVLSADDLAGYAAHVEAPLTYDYHGWTVAKCGPWTQGPVFLQTLALLKGFDLSAMDPMGADFIHHVVEAKKLAYADREVYYGDPDFAQVPLDVLLSDDYNAARAKLIGAKASLDLRPGTVPGFEDQLTRTMDLLGRLSRTDQAVYEPTMAHLSEKKGDTVHIDVIDAEGNMVAITPSGGWLQSSPTIPGLGFCLNSRAQMFWLEPGLPTSLEPGKRPRTTLSPAMVLKDGAPFLAIGTPGGDHQDQQIMNVLLRVLAFGQPLQAAIEAPRINSSHFHGSFAIKKAEPGALEIEDRVPQAVRDGLAARGHKLDVLGPFGVSTGIVAAGVVPETGTLRGAADVRRERYAFGW